MSVQRLAICKSCRIFILCRCASSQHIMHSLKCPCAWARFIQAPGCARNESLSLLLALGKEVFVQVVGFLPAAKTG